MMGAITTEDKLLTRAFDLAYFILGDRTIAVYVAMSAVDKLKIASTAQDRRFVYTPVGRFTHPAIRTKIRLSETHLLQRLIYAESEPFERLLEGQRRATQEDMIIRFVKQLVRITIRHNSFYLTLGLCRLLHNYTTTETAEIYNFLIQDPDRTKDDYYYRSRKQHLMREMKERFGHSLQTYRGHRGEERFQAEEDSTKYARLVAECLRRFTPWQSDCVLPAQFDANKQVVAPLLFEGQDPDEEHQIELDRIHTVLHPDCFERVIANLGLDPSRERLELPQFSDTSNDQRLSADRFKPVALDESEADAVKGYLERNEGHRRLASAESLSLLVDGYERARFEINLATGIQFEVRDGAEAVELRSFELDEEIPLAIHMLSYGESGILPSAFSVIPKRGQNLDFEIQVEKGPSGEAARSLVCVNVGNIERVTASTSLRRRLLMLVDALRGTPRDWPGIVLLRFAPAILVIVIALVGLLIYFKSRQASNNQTLVAEQREDDRRVTPPQVPVQTEDRPAPKNSIRESEPGRSGRPAVSNPDRGRDSTRRAEWVSDPTVLLTVRRVYVDPLGDTLMSRHLRERLRTDLQSSNRFLVVENRDDADAVFKGVAKTSGESGNRASLVLRLVNAEGKVVWPVERETAGRKHTGTSESISEQVLKTLLNDIARLERAR